MRRSGIFALLVIVSSFGPASVSADTGVGLNYGLTFTSFEDDESATTIALPGSATLGIPASVPGFRVAFRNDHGQQFYVDTGLFYYTSSGADLTTFEITGNFQHEFSPEESVSPYITAGIGVYHLSFGDEDGSTNPVLGGGVGIRKIVAGGHGDFRFEAHVDHVFEDEEGIQSFNAFSPKLGFDLWMGP